LFSFLQDQSFHPFLSFAIIQNLFVKAEVFENGESFYIYVSEAQNFKHFIL